MDRVEPRLLTQATGRPGNDRRDAGHVPVHLQPDHCRHAMPQGGHSRRALPGRPSKPFEGLAVSGPGVPVSEESGVGEASVILRTCLPKKGGLVIGPHTRSQTGVLPFMSGYQIEIGDVFVLTIRRLRISRKTDAVTRPWASMKRS